MAYNSDCRVESKDFSRSEPDTYAVEVVISRKLQYRDAVADH